MQLEWLGKYRRLVEKMVKFGNSKQKALEPLSEQRAAEIKAGVGRDGRGMLEITGAMEANGATPINDCHVNTFFSDYGQALMGVYGDYETVVKQADKRGGISFLDHTGEYVGCEDDPEMAKQPYYINKFANIFLKYDSCVAIDVNSGKNNRTRYDYILWDEILKVTIPYGRNVSCIAFTDGHHIDEYDRAFTMMCMPENSLSAFRTCLETGAYFSVGRYARADLGEEFVGEGAPPKVTKLHIDQEADSISFDAEEFDYVRWYSDGELIAEGKDITSLDLDDYRLLCPLYADGQGRHSVFTGIPDHGAGHRTAKDSRISRGGRFRVYAWICQCLQLPVRINTAYAFDPRSAVGQNLVGLLRFKSKTAPPVQGYFLH